MLLSYSYKGLLLSFLSFLPKVGVRNIAELSEAVASGSHRCFTVAGSHVITALQVSRDPAVRIIGESLMKNSGNLTGYKNLMNYKGLQTAFIGPRTVLRGYEKRFFLSEDSFFTSFIAVAVRKAFCCKKKLDETIRRTFEAGLYEKFIRGLEESDSMRLNPPPVDMRDSKALTIDDITGALYIIIAGYILAVLDFIGEIIHGKLDKIF